MTYTPPPTQEDFDKAIAERLARQKAQIEAQYADFDSLKEKAAEFDKAQDAAKTELQKALDRASIAEKEAAELKAADKARIDKEAADKQVSDWIAEVSKDTNVPAELLRGTTKEELEAHANALKPVIVATRNGVVPNEGEKPKANATPEERAVAAQLFGSNQ